MHVSGRCRAKWILIGCAPPRPPLVLPPSPACPIQALCFSFHIKGLKLHVVNSDYLDVRLVDKASCKDAQYLRLLGTKTYRFVPNEGGGFSFIMEAAALALYSIRGHGCTHRDIATPSGHADPSSLRVPARSCAFCATLSPACTMHITCLQEHQWEGHRSEHHPHGAPHAACTGMAVHGGD